VQREELAMAISTADLDSAQLAYKTAVDRWISAIREEEALASGNHSEVQIDRWEQAGDSEESARSHAKAAKKAYEAALREEFFNF
jgi:hypothetical protein